MNGIITNKYLLVFLDAIQTQPLVIVNIERFKSNGVSVTHKSLYDMIINNKSTKADLRSSMYDITTRTTIKPHKLTGRQKFGDSAYEFYADVTIGENSYQQCIVKISGVRKETIDGDKKIVIDLESSGDKLVYNLLIASDKIKTEVQVKYYTEYANGQNTNDFNTNSNIKLREYIIPSTVNVQYETNNGNFQKCGIYELPPASLVTEQVPLKSISKLPVAHRIAVAAVKDSMSNTLQYTDYSEYVGRIQTRTQLSPDSLDLWTMDDAKDYIKNNGTTALNSVTNEHGQGISIGSDGTIYMENTTIKPSGEVHASTLAQEGSKELRNDGVLNVQTSSNSMSDILPQHNAFIVNPKYTFHFGRFYKVINRITVMVQFGFDFTSKITTIITKTTDVVNIYKDEKSILDLKNEYNTYKEDPNKDPNKDAEYLKKISDIQTRIDSFYKDKSI